MNLNLLKKLKEWRDATAKSEMTDFFRVLPNRTIEEIAKLEPKTKEELTSIKGIKDKKYYKYGKEILSVVKSENKNADKGLGSKCSELSSLPRSLPHSLPKEKIYSVSKFLDFLNEMLVVNEIRIKGEITSIDERERVVYFGIKDKEDESTLNCLIFRYQYEISGVKLEAGKEVIIDGHPEIYKPNGRLSLKASLVEIAGEGAIKKSYDELKKKLEKEGLFSLERKRPLPNLPQVIGLITSNQGAAIGDFITNIGKYGFKIKFVNSNVEGKRAIFDLIRAVRMIKKIKDIDALAIVRGGGSLESLQAFNNEALVREIAKLEIPVVCGVGHEKDISLVSLVSDLAVSTPTAAARAIRESWDVAVNKLDYNQRTLLNCFERHLSDSGRRIEKISHNLNYALSGILSRFAEVKNNLTANFEKIRYSIYNSKKAVVSYTQRIIIDYQEALALAKSKIRAFENTIKLNSPERQLKLGYSIVSFEGKVMRSIKQVKKGDNVDIKVSDGRIKSRVEKIN